MANPFNTVFNAKAWSELDRRSKMPDSWKYKKYAYINLELTGKSSTNICVEDATLKIGDTNSGKLYTTDGDSGPRRPNITLQSVNITNQGGSDYTDSYLYEIETSFKVWSKGQMDQVEKGFFRLGAEMKVSFGWRGLIESGINKDSILASIYNFGFTMDNDGSYTCNVKAMSAAGLFGHETMAGEVRTDSTGIKKPQLDPAKSPFLNAMEVFRNMARTAFGIDDSQKDNDADGFASDNEVIYKSHKHTNSGKTMVFAFAELELPSISRKVALGGGNDTNVLYTSLAAIFDYLNYISSKDGMFELKWTGAGSEYLFAPAEKNFNKIGSSNPFRTFIPINDAGIYGTTLKFQQPPNLGSDIGKIFLNIDTVTEAYNDLQGSAPVKNGPKTPPKTKDFLSKIFSMIETDTGGIVRLQTRSVTTDLDSTNGVPIAGGKSIVSIFNRSMIRTKAKKEVPKPYPFKVLGETSITRNVSLQTEFDTDFLLKASRKSIKEGSSNMQVLSGLYTSCDKLKPTSAEATPATETLATYDDIKALKKDIGDEGWTSEKSDSLASTIQKYVGQNSHAIAAGAFAEVPMMLKLGVTIDGISGVKYMSPITIDRLPKAYTGKGIDFPIISIEHSFDGQGDWSTTYETVMRIK